MILFGGCGAIQNVQKINSPSALDELSNEFEQAEYEINKELGRATDTSRAEMEAIDSSDTELSIEFQNMSSADSAGIAMFEGMFGSVSNILTFSDYYKKWIVRLGIIGLIASIIYGVAGLLLLMGKKFAVKSAIGAIIISTLSVIFQIIIISADIESGFAAKAGNFTSYFVIFVNIILFIVIMASDKSYFNEVEEDFA